MEDAVKIQKELQSRAETKQKCYDRHLQYCLVQIKSKIHYADVSYFIHSVPTFFFGYPAYDMSECCAHLIYNLKQMGFECEYNIGGHLFIGWKSIIKKSTKPIENKFMNELKTILKHDKQRELIRKSVKFENGHTVMEI